MAVAWVLLAASSLRQAFFICALTVSSVMERRLEISPLVFPQAVHLNTSVSRGESCKGFPE